MSVTMGKPFEQLGAEEKGALFTAIAQAATGCRAYTDCVWPIVPPDVAVDDDWLVDEYLQRMLFRRATAFGFLGGD